MTAFIIQAFGRRAEQIKAHLTGNHTGSGSSDEPVRAPYTSSSASEGCTFCNIASGSEEAYTVYSDDRALAFLDVYPIRKGHLLLVSKSHHERLTDMPPDEAAYLGSLLPRLTRALSTAVANPDLTVVLNIGPSAGQVVPHAHFHLVPAPQLGSSYESNPASSWGGFSISGAGGRTELSPEAGEALAKRIKEILAKEG